MRLNTIAASANQGIQIHYFRYNNIISIDIYLTLLHPRMVYYFHKDAVYVLWFHPICLKKPCLEKLELMQLVSYLSIFLQSISPNNYTDSDNLILWLIHV